MRRLGRGNNGGTKRDGEDQGEDCKVKGEDDLKDERGDGENFPKDGVEYVKGTVHCEGGNDRPR